MMCLPIINAKQQQTSETDQKENAVKKCVCSECQDDSDRYAQAFNDGEQDGNGSSAITAVTVAIEVAENWYQIFGRKYVAAIHAIRASFLRKVFLATFGKAWNKTAKTDADY